jgi:hypothetical protein
VTPFRHASALWGTRVALPRPNAHGISTHTIGDVDVVRVAGIEVVFDAGTMLRGRD